MGKKMVGLVVVVAIVALLSVIALARLNSIDPKRITVYLPKAYEYVYPDQTAYKGATEEPPINAIRDIDEKTAIPLSLKKGEQRLTLGIKNGNKKPIKEVMIFLELPRDFSVTKPGAWVQLKANTYYCSFGNINKGVRYTTEESIFFKPAKTGKEGVKYTITGQNFKRTSGVMSFETY